MKPRPRRTPAAERSRLRLIVVRVLVFSLFATLFARLYYLQVVSGDSYHAAAASQSLREVVVQPQRGLIVDDQGRPLVANRTAWVVSVDRTLLGRLSGHDRAVVLHRRGRRGRHPLRQVKQALVTCGDPGSVRGRCWNGSPYQPVPVATDVRQSVALRILEQPEDYPAVVAQQQSVRAYPEPYGVNLADIVGYLSPITAGELSRPSKDHDTSVNGASTVGRAGIEQEYDRYLRGRPGYQRVAVDSMGRVLGDEGEVAGRPGDTLVTSIDAQRPGRHRARAAPTRSRRPGDVRPGDPPQLPRRLRRRDRAAGQDRPRRRHGQPADVRPVAVGRRHHQQAAGPALLGEGRRPAAGAGLPGPVRARLDLEADHDRRRVQQRLGAGAPGSTARPVFQVGNRLFHNYESESLRDDRLRQGAAVLLRHVLLPRRLPLLAEVRPDPTNVNARDPLVSEAKAFGFGRPTGIDVPGRGVRPDRRPALEARVLEVDEELLLRHRPAPAGRDQRLPQAVRPRVLPRGQLLPGR